MSVSLVTGGAGFIGSHVVDHLIRLGHKVYVIDDLSGGSRSNLPEDARLFTFDIRNTNDVDYVVKNYQPDYIFHLAAYAAEGLSHYIRHYNYEVNVLGSVNLINAAVNWGVKRFVFASSAAVYGEGRERAYNPFIESCQPNPVDPYGLAKWTVEQDLKLASDIFDLKYTVFRMHNVFGPRQNLNDAYRNVAAIFFRQALQGKPMTIYGDGYQSRHFSFIDDVAPGIAETCAMSETENEIFNIGDGESISINELAGLIYEKTGAILPRHQAFVHLPPRHEARHIRLEHFKFSEIYKRQSFTSITDGLNKMAAWAKTQELREPKPFTEIEITKNMPEHWRKLADVH